MAQPSVCAGSTLQATDTTFMLAPYPYRSHYSMGRAAAMRIVKMDRGTQRLWDMEYVVWCMLRRPTIMLHPISKAVLNGDQTGKMTPTVTSLGLRIYSDRRQPA